MMKSKTNILSRKFFLPIILLLLNFIVLLNRADAKQDVWITQQPTPATQTINAGGTVAAYTVAGSYKNLINQTKSAGNYQWYSNTVNSTSGGSAISGANGSTYTPPASTPGTRYYWCNVQESGYGNANTNIATVTVVAVKPTLGILSIPTQNYGASYTITPSTSNSAGAFTYTSKNTAIASVIGNTLISNSVGKDTIVAIQAANGIYAADTSMAIFNVVPIAPTTSFSLPNQFYSGTTILLTIMPPTSNSTGAFTYSIAGSNSGAGVATISANVITITNGGMLYIKAIQAAAGNYLADTITTTLAIAVNAPANISYTTPNTFGMDAAITPLSPTAIASGIITLGSGFSNPRGVAVDAAGNVYVANVNISLINKIAVNGKIDSLGSGFKYARGVAVDVAGNVYVADKSNYAVKKIATDGSIITLASGIYNGAAIAVDAAGNVYVCDANDVKKINANGTNITVLGSGFSMPQGVAVDVAGNVYVADYGNSAVKKIASDGVSVTTLGLGFDHPQGVAVDIAGNVYVADPWNNALKKIAINGTTTTLGLGLAIAGIAVDALGNVYASNANNVIKIPATGGPVSSYTISPALPAGLSINSTTGVISGTPTVVINGTTNYTVTASNYGGSKTAVLSIYFPNVPDSISYTTPNTFTVGAAISPLSPTAVVPGISTIGSGFNYPQAITLDATGNVYVADVYNNAIKKIAVNGTVTSLGSGFSYPSGVAVDAAGNVYVGDYGNSKLKKIAVNGIVTTLGSGFVSPAGLAVDASGNVYVANAGNSAGYSSVQKLAADGVTITTLGSGFNRANAVAVDAAGNVYVADAGNNAVKKIATDGVTVTTLGSGFTNPVGVAVDASGNVYVSEYTRAVKKIATDGVTVTTLANDMAPIGVTLDGFGNVYVSSTNNTIKKISAPGGAVSTYSIAPTLPAGVSINSTTGVISGTPTAVSAAATYTVTASNGGGSKTGVVNIGVIAGCTASTATFTVTNCGSYTWTAKGNKVYTANNNTDTIRLKSAGGCDSLVTLNLTIKTATTSTNSATACGSYWWNGVNYTTSGVKTKTFTGGNSKGCDSTATLNLTINTPTTSSNNATACGSYWWNGVTYTTSGVKTKTFTGGNSRGCDSTATLNLTINTTTSTNSATAAGSYLWNGVTYTTSGVKTKTFTGGNSNGCDSTAILNLTIYFPNAPDSISYTTPNTFDVGTAISPLSPTAIIPDISTIASGVSQPFGVAVDAAGSVYVAAAGNNAVKKIDLNGTIATLGSGFKYPTGVALDRSGNVYVADFSNNAIKKIAVDGTITTLGSGFSQPAGVAVDAAGNVYVADWGNDAVKKITVNGAVTTLGSGFNQPWSVSLDAAGNVFVADKGNNAVKKIATDGNITILGSGFSQPAGVAVDVVGNVYVAVAGNNAIKKIATDGTTITTLYASAYSAGGVALDTLGNVYFSATGTYTVMKIPAVGGAVSAYGIAPALPAGVSINTTTGIISGTPTVATAVTNYTVTASNGGGSKKAVVTIETIGAMTSCTPNGSTTSLIINSTALPYSWNGLSFTAAGTQTKHFTNAGGCDSAATLTLTVVFTVAPDSIKYNTPNIFISGTPISPLSPTAIVPAISTVASELNYPQGITLDATGNLYVADMFNNVIKKIAVNGTFTTLGSGFSYPTGVALDAAGNIYVADNGNSKVKKIAVNGMVTTLASGLISPVGVAVDAVGNVYVVNAGNSGGYSTVQKIATDGAPITTLGSGFKRASAVALDAAGNVYVADAGNNAVKKIATDGVTVTTLGSGFTNPVGVALDASGNVYVSEYTRAVKKIATDGVTVTTLANGMNPIAIAADGLGNVYVSSTGNTVKKIPAPGGAVSAYSISRPLPAGLSINSTTGIISGTPTVARAATNYTVTASNGGGSATGVVNIGVIPSCTASTATFTVANCGSYIWAAKGNKVYTTNNNTDTIRLKNAGGCDSLVTLNLTINSPTGSINYATACDSYFWNGVVYKTSGLKLKFFSGGNSKGCDSMARLILTINTATTSSNSVTACGSYWWNGVNYTTSGVKTKTFTSANSNGCDSTATLNLTITTPVRPTINITASDTAVCEGTAATFTANTTNEGSSPFYYWYKNGSRVGSNTNSYTTAALNDGDKISCKLESSSRCLITTLVSSNIVTMKVSSASFSTTSQHVNVSALPYSWNGNSYNSSDSYTVHLTNAAGCDSAATLNLNLWQPLYDTVVLQVCSNAVPYSWNGNGYSTSGTYNYTTQTNNGQDSITTLKLQVLSSSASTTSVTTCSTAMPYLWNGNTYNSAGTYTYTSTNAVGCDSVETMVLSVLQPSSSNTSVTVCNNSMPYNWNGLTFSTAGTYVYTTTNAVGCDSVVTLNLTVSQANTGDTTVTTNSNFVWYGNTYSSSATPTYTFTNVSGCDSVVTLHLTINKGTFTDTTVISCAISYTYRGIARTTSGDYTYNYTNDWGAPSVAILHLLIGKPAMPSPISGPTDACTLMISSANPLGTEATYTIRKCANTTQYNWSGFTNATIVGHPAGLGVNDTTVTVLFAAGFQGAANGEKITVTAGNACGVSAAAGIAVSRKLPTQPVNITGTTKACTDATYLINKASVADGYLWSTSDTIFAHITAHPAGVGVNDTAITVHFDRGYSGGTINVSATRNCGVSNAKTLSVVKLVPANAPLAITITPVVTDVCGARVYRYAAPDLPAATGATSAPTGYVWSFTGSLGLTATVDSGALTTQVVRMKYTSNAASLSGEDVRLYYTAACENSNVRYIRLTNTALTTVAPANITASLVSDTCGARVYRYSASLVVATPTSAAASSYKWTMPTFGAAAIDSGDINLDRIIKVKYKSNASSAATDLISVSTNPACGNSTAKAIALGIKAKTGCPASPASRVATSIVKESETVARVYPNPSKGNFTISFQSKAKAATATIQLLGAQGNVLRTVKVPVNSDGSVTTQLSFIGIASGTYQARYMVGNASGNLRVVIVQ